MGFQYGKAAGLGLMGVAAAGVIASFAPQSVLYTGAINSAQILGASAACGVAGVASYLLEDQSQ